MSLTSDEVNFLIYRYLLEAGKCRAAQKVALAHLLVVRLQEFSGASCCAVAVYIAVARAGHAASS
jgi:hypothetical protein